VHPNTTARSRVRRVALLAIDRLDPDALCYALNACQRLGACLDVLTNLPSQEADRVVIGARGRGDTPWRIIRIGGEGGDDVCRYARNESGLLFLTSSAGDEKALGFHNNSGPDGLRPGISWVVVESRQFARESI
jgi:hypothetical protein